MVDAIKDPAQANLAELQQMILNSGAMQYTREFAQREIDLAKQAAFELKDSVHKQALLNLADFVVLRNA